MRRVSSWFLPILIVATFVAAEPALEEEGRSFVALLDNGDYAGAVVQFDETMSAAMPEAKMKATWEEVLSQAGAFVEQLGVTKERYQGYDIAVVTCRFEQADLAVKVVFDDSRRIAGLFFAPAGKAPTPAYADSESFSESEVVVGEGEWALPGTLAVPSGDGPFPAVVLVHGSGPNDRDETIGPNKPFRDIAWGLANPDARGEAGGRHPRVDGPGGEHRRLPGRGPPAARAEGDPRGRHLRRGAQPGGHARPADRHAGRSDPWFRRSRRPGPAAARADTGATRLHRPSGRRGHRGRKARDRGGPQGRREDQRAERGGDRARPGARPGSGIAILARPMWSSWSTPSSTTCSSRARGRARRPSIRCPATSRRKSSETSPTGYGSRLEDSPALDRLDVPPPLGPALALGLRSWLHRKSGALVRHLGDLDVAGG